MTKSKGSANRRRHELVVVHPNLGAVPQALRYYDPELQNAWNTEPPDPERVNRAQLKAKRLLQAYMKQIAALRPRLGGSTYSRFSDKRYPLFDSNLLAFSFGDSLDCQQSGLRGWRPKTRAEARFLSFDMETIHVLKYRDIESLQVDWPAQRWFSHAGCKDIDSLLFNELTPAGQTLMQHKFLFVSGATISIRFGKVMWETTRVPRADGGKR